MYFTLLTYKSLTLFYGVLVYNNTTLVSRNIFFNFDTLNNINDSPNFNFYIIITFHNGVYFQSNLIHGKAYLKWKLNDLPLTAVL